MEYTLNNSNMAKCLPAREYERGTISGFDGAVDSLIKLGRTLEDHEKLLFIFFDQFENMFFLLDTLSRIRDLFVKVVDAQTNIVFGFSWKADLVGLTNEFPYQMRDTITSTSKRVALDTFSDIETTTLLDRLRDELRAPPQKRPAFLFVRVLTGLPMVIEETLRSCQSTT